MISPNVSTVSHRGGKGHCEEQMPAELARRVGAHHTLKTVVPRLRCERCGVEGKVSL